MSYSKDPVGYKRIKELFNAVLDVLPEKRSTFLSEQNADPEILAEVNSLLAARESAGEFLNDLSATGTFENFTNLSNHMIGRKVGNYLIEKEIGRGGMGIVFLATREEFYQQTALKLIKRGMDSDAILERFTREREILAALNHPYIARLTDGGTTDDGLPFFVMEYVDGLSIDRYCKAKNLSENEIVELFRKVCVAVAFAHQKLIVHRDIKPSNILITAEGIPKLLDFGIAKLLKSSGAAAETQTNLRVLTPAYASPEQIRGEVVDTTSDVYSLGKILTELLQGKDAGTSKEVFGAQTVPMPPKVRLQTDLKNILAMAMHAENARRYGSVEKFSEDARRYLAGLPVSARKDTFSYRAIKFVQRKRYTLAFLLLFLLTMSAGLAATLWQAREARRERAVAERRLDNLRNISSGFITEIHSAIQDLPGSLPARQLLLTQAVDQLDALAAESGDNPALDDALARAYHNSAELPDMLLAKKELTFKKEIAIYQKLLAVDAANIHYRERLALAEMELGDITKVRGSLARGIELELHGVTLLEEIAAQDPDNIEHWLNLAGAEANIATLYISKNDAQEATRRTMKELNAVEKIKKLNPSEPKIDFLQNIGNAQLGSEQILAGDYVLAIQTLGKCLTDYKELQAKAPNDTKISYYLWGTNRRLANALEKKGDIYAAKGHYRAALSIIEDLASQSPRDFGYARNSALTNTLFGQLLVSQKKPAEAIKYFKRAIELSQKVLENDADNSESKSDYAWATGNLGNALSFKGETSEAIKFLSIATDSLAEISTTDSDNMQVQQNYSQTVGWLKELTESR